MKRLLSILLLLGAVIGVNAGASDCKSLTPKILTEEAKTEIRALLNSESSKLSSDQILRLTRFVELYTSPNAHLRYNALMLAYGARVAPQVNVNSQNRDFAFNLLGFLNPRGFLSEKNEDGEFKLLQFLTSSADTATPKIKLVDAEFGELRRLLSLNLSSLSMRSTELLRLRELMAKFLPLTPLARQHVVKSLYGVETSVLLNIEFNNYDFAFELLKVLKDRGNLSERDPSQEFKLVLLLTTTYYQSPRELPPPPAGMGDADIAKLESLLSTSSEDLDSSFTDGIRNITELVMNFSSYKSVDRHYRLAGTFGNVVAAQIDNSGSNIDFASRLVHFLVLHDLLDKRASDGSYLLVEFLR